MNERVEFAIVATHALGELGERFVGGHVARIGLRAAEFGREFLDFVLDAFALIDERQSRTVLVKLARDPGCDAPAIRYAGNQRDLSVKQLPADSFIATGLQCPAEARA